MEFLRRYSIAFFRFSKTTIELIIIAIHTLKIMLGIGNPLPLYHLNLQSSLWTRKK